MGVKFPELIFGQDGATQEMKEAIFRKGWTEIGDEPPTAEMMTWLFQQNQLYAQYNANKWRASTDYEVGNIIYASSITNSHLMMECTVAGTTGTIEPTWGVIGSTVTDGTAQWQVCTIQDTSVGTSQGRRVVLGADNKIDTELMPEEVVKISDFTQSLSTSGWLKLPNGVIIQWRRNVVGTANSSGAASISVGFPIAFPTAVFTAVVTPTNEGNATNGVICNTQAPTLLGIIAHLSGSAANASVAVNIIAIGR